MKARLGIVLAAATLLSSCGPQTLRKSDSVTEYTRQSENPIILKSTHKNCSDILAQSNNKEFKVSLLINGAYEQRFLDMSNTLLGNNLGKKDSSLILSTQFDISEINKYAALYDSKRNVWKKNRFPSQTIRLKSGKDVSICPGIIDNSENTIESASLATNFLIDKTKTKVLAAIPELRISAVDIKINPLYRSELIHKKRKLIQYDTDNAFYRPYDKTIQFLPQSKEALEKNVFGGHPLWEIPMVASHEYGHHIFSELYPEHFQFYRKNILESANCFNSLGDHEHIYHSDNYRSEKRKIRRIDNFRALNEGFADLISFYSLERNESKLTGVNCMQRNREVSSSRYGDGTNKAFTNQVKMNFYSEVANLSDGNCSTPDFQSIHTVGAIFAYSTDRLLSVYTNNKRLKLKVILTWIQNMSSNHMIFKSMSTKDQFGAAYSLMLKTVNEEFSYSKSIDACKIAKRQYPGFDFNSANSFNKCN